MVAIFPVPNADQEPGRERRAHFLTAAVLSAMSPLLLQALLVRSCHQSGHACLLLTCRHGPQTTCGSFRSPTEIPGTSPPKYTAPVPRHQDCSCFALSGPEMSLVGTSWVDRIPAGSVPCSSFAQGGIAFQSVAMSSPAFMPALWEAESAWRRGGCGARPIERKPLDVTDHHPMPSSTPRKLPRCTSLPPVAASHF